MLLQLRNLSLSLGGPPLLNGANLVIEPGERLCLVGRNGAGKSTLLKVLQGSLAVDSGEISRTDGMRIAYLRQDVPDGRDGTIYDIVAEGLGDLGRWLARYEVVSHQLADGQGDLEELSRLQSRIEAVEGWTQGQRIQNVLSRMALEGSLAFSTLSGGMKRRVLLAQALVQSPDLLLLDEPTNHLDIVNILWLEEFLLDFPGTLLFVSHDRRFVRRLATRIIELDRGKLTSWPGSYDKYLQGKEEQLATEARHNTLFDKQLAQEEVWIRQGVKARRTRNEGRVRALEQLRLERSQRRNTLGKATLNTQTVAASGRLVVEAENISKTQGGRQLIKDFSTTIVRGDKVGILGANGCGKTTLINMLLGRLAPDAGQIRLGTQLEVAYFDQLRETLDQEARPIDVVGQGSDVVMQNGKPRHVIGYLQDFLFTPEQARGPISTLSGGERNRLLLAKILSNPANVLVLDEPTNDLDVETLEQLESMLVDYAGTLIIVSHDRDFINNLVTSCIAFEDDGTIKEYVGGYDDYLRQRARPSGKSAPAEKPAANRASEPVVAPRKKLSFNDERERQQLPARIEALELKQAELSAQRADPAFYQGPNEAIQTLTAALKALEIELNQAYQRWESLENTVRGS